jgi:hypothetical protein
MSPFADPVVQTHPSVSTDWPTRAADDQTRTSLGIQAERALVCGKEAPRPGPAAVIAWFAKPNGKSQ